MHMLSEKSFIFRVNVAMKIPSNRESEYIYIFKHSVDCFDTEDRGSKKTIFRHIQDLQLLLAVLNFFRQKYPLINFCNP